MKTLDELIHMYDQTRIQKMPDTEAGRLAAAILILAFVLQQWRQADKKP